MNFKTKFFTLVFLLSFCSFIFCPKASAEVKTFTVSAKAFIGDNQTKNDARMLATLEAKRRALEQAGTYLESLTIVENFQLKKDEILAFTAGVAKTEIIEEKPIVEGSSFGLEITAKVTVDTSILAEKIKKLKEDNTLLEQNKELIKRNNELEEALKIINNLINSDKIKKYKEEIEAIYNATEWFNKGYDAQAILKDNNRAIEYYTNAISLDPEFAIAYTNCGTTYYKESYYDSSIADYTKAGGIYIKKGEYDNAIKDFAKIVKIANKLIDNRKELYDKSDEELKKLPNGNEIINEKKFCNNLFNRILGQTILTGEELYIYQNLINNGYDNDNALYNIYKYERDNSILKFISINGNVYLFAYIGLGCAYHLKGNYVKAIQDYTIAIILDPKYPLTYYNRGGAYEKKGNYDKAISDYSKAIELDPIGECGTDVKGIAYSNRGNIYHYKKGNYDKAIADYTKAIELNPQFGVVYYDIGIAHYKKGNYDSAISDYNKAIELNPQYADAYNNRGIAYEKLGNCQKANEDYKKACSLGYKDACSYKCN